MQLQLQSNFQIESIIIRDVVFVKESDLIIFGGSDKILYFYNYKTEKIEKQFLKHSDQIYRIKILSLNQNILRVISLSKEMIDWQFQLEGNQIINYDIINQIKVYSQFPMDIVIHNNCIFLTNYYQINEEYQFSVQILNLYSFKVISKIPLQYKAISLFYSKFLDKLLIGDSQAKLIFYDLENHQIIAIIENICQNYPFNIQECYVSNLFYNQQRMMQQQIIKNTQKNVKILIISSFNCHIYLIEQLEEFIKNQEGLQIENQFEDIRLVNFDQQQSIINVIGQQRALFCAQDFIIFGGSDQNIKLYQNSRIQYSQLINLTLQNIKTFLTKITYNDTKQNIQFNFKNVFQLEQSHQDIINKIDCYQEKKLIVSCGFDGLINIYSYK